jgi:hypothetical protein
VLLGRVLGSGTEKLALDTGVSRAGDVLSVAPLSITRSTSSRSATARVTVEVTATAVTTTSTTPAASAVVVALEGRNIVAPVVLAGTVVLVSPGTVVDAVGRRTTVHSEGTTLRATLGTSLRTTLGTGGRRTTTATHVRRDVGSTLGRALVTAIVEGEATHVDLISHVYGRFLGREICRDSRVVKTREIRNRQINSLKLSRRVVVFGEIPVESKDRKNKRKKRKTNASNNFPNDNF